MSSRFGLRMANCLARPSASSTGSLVAAPWSGYRCEEVISSSGVPRNSDIGGYPNSSEHKQPNGESVITRIASTTQQRGLYLKCWAPQEIKNELGLDSGRINLLLDRKIWLARSVHRGVGGSGDFPLPTGADAQGEKVRVNRTNWISSSNSTSNSKKNRCAGPSLKRY